MLKHPNFTHARGFTLIEITIVIVMVGVIAVVGSQFLVSSIDGYRTAEIANKLAERGRLSIEQITREIHMALPNAIRTSSSGDCIEFMPIVASTSYQGVLPDPANTIPSVSTIPTSSFTLGKGAARHVVVAPFAPAEVYTNTSPASKVGVGVLGAAPYSAIPLASSHNFLRNSLNNRVFITDDPVRYCVVAGNLVRYSNFGLLATTLTNADPGGATDIASHEVAATASNKCFVVSGGSEDANIAVHINLVFSKGQISLDLTHQVLIRNVP